MTRKDFLSRLGMLAKVCDFQLTSDWVALYERALSRFGYDRAVTAIEDAILQRRGNERMPSIGDLAQRCAPEILESDTAVEVSGRVLTAITRFGWSNPVDAADWIGEVGWAVVERNGGWKTLCETVREKDLPMWRAQLREQAGAVIRRQKAGILEIAPKFGEVANAQKVAALVGQVLNKSEEYPNDKAGNPRGISP